MNNFKVIITSEDQYAVSNANTRKWYLSILDLIKRNQGETTIHVATSLQFGALRLGVMRKELQPFDFEFNKKTLYVQEKGNLHPHWEIGLFDEGIPQVKAMMSGKSHEESEKDHIESMQRRLKKRNS
jgi:hypothetical protein